MMTTDEHWFNISSLMFGKEPLKWNSGEAELPNKVFPILLDFDYNYVMCGSIK